MDAIFRHYFGLVYLYCKPTLLWHMGSSTCTITGFTLGGKRMFRIGGAQVVDSCLGRLAG